MDTVYYIFIIAFWFGLAILMTFLTYPNTSSFLAWLMIFNCFFTWSALLPLWSLILLIVVNIIYIAIKRYGSVI